MQLQIQSVTKRYGDLEALKELDLDIGSGGVFGLVGPNGAGKSTLMRILATLIRPNAGHVLLDGTDIRKHPDAMRRLLGYLPQDVAVYPNLTATEYLHYIASLKGIKRADATQQIASLLATFHLADAGKRKLSDYSGGMRQRAGIAAALLGDPQVIIVDEPSVGLDPEERINLRNLLCALAETRIVLLSTHIISDIESTAARLAVIQNGSLLFCGTPAEFTKSTGGDMERAYLAAVHGEAAL